MKRFSKLLAITLTIAAFAAILVSCKNDPEPVVQVASVTVAPSTLTIKIGEKSLLNATVEPDNAADKTLNWTSSSDAIATVSNGEVTAIAIGNATITATASNGVKGTSVITVVTNVVPETGVSIDRDTVDFFVGDKQTLVATVEPENASNKAVIWSSDFPQIASVNTNTGEVTATGGGVAKITATTVNGFTDTCVVRVVLPLTDITLDATSLELVEGSRYQIVATPVPSNATNYDPVWSSSDPDVATVTQEGLVEAIYEGMAVITLASDTIVRTVEIIVNSALPRAKLFDWTAREDGTVYDASPNKLEIITGPATPTVQWNSYYGRYEAIIRIPLSRKYENDAVFGNEDYSSYQSVRYQDYRHRTDPGQYGEYGTLGETKGMGFYKIPWSNNQAMFDAYTNAFSYELVFMVPNDRYINGMEFSEGMYLFGNLNPTHSGFGIMLWADWWTSQFPISFRACNRWGPGFGQSTMKHESPIEYDKYYHVIVTYDRHNPNEVRALYIDGEKVLADTEYIGEYMFLPVDWYYGDLNNMRDRRYEPGITPRQDYMENLWMGGVAHQSGWPNTAYAPSGTRYVIARVYDKALTATQVSDLYAAITK